MMMCELAVTAMNKYLSEARQQDRVSSFLKEATIKQCLAVRNASEAEAALEAVTHDMAAGGM